MKKYELESFFKSFFSFFLLLEILLAINFWNEYEVKIIEFDEKIHMQMKICAFTLECHALKTDFVDKGKDREENILYKDSDYYAYFQVPTAEKYLMKVLFTSKDYVQKMQEIKEKLYHKFLLYTIFSIVVSFLFSLYALFPLRLALRTNEEFVKDILHDFNTPISSMFINFALLKREIGTNNKIQRLENNLQSILSLQDNLKMFLKEIPTQTEKLSLRALLIEKVAYFKILYPTIKYTIKVKKCKVQTNKEVFLRILDNLLSNAGKYNVENGKVEIILEGKHLLIKDTGKGIKNPSKVFDRYYKEQDRGIGIGLHIVKKLCDELKVIIIIKSTGKQGTMIDLDLSQIML